MNLENFHVKVFLVIKFLKMYVSGFLRQNYMILTHMCIYKSHRLFDVLTSNFCKII